MTTKSKRTEREGHPGWSVRFVDGTWLGGAHGWFRADNAFYADIYDSKEEGQKWLEYLRKDEHNECAYDLDAEVIPAWEPLCEKLRLDVKMLEEANNITPYDIMDVVSSLENIIADLKEKMNSDEEADQND